MISKTIEDLVKAEFERGLTPKRLAVAKGVQIKTKSLPELYSDAPMGFFEEVVDLPSQTETDRKVNK